MFQKKRLALIIVLLLAALLRLWPLSFPADENVDEQFVVSNALRMGQDGLIPHSYKYPPSFLYILFINYGARYAVEKGAGLVNSPADFAGRYFLEPLSFFIQGRIVAALFGVFAVLAIYILAESLFRSWQASTFAALVIAVSPIIVRDSHFAIVDGPALIPFIFSLFFAIKLLKEEKKSYVFLSGFLAGIATATKYPFGIAFIALITATFYSMNIKIKEKVSFLIYGAIGLVSGFLIICPWALLDFENFRRDILLIVGYMSAFEESGLLFGVKANRGYLPYLIQYLPVSLGWPIYVIGLLGLISWLYNDNRHIMPIILSAVVYWIIMGASKNHVLGFTIPMLPAIALGAAWWIAYYTPKTTKKKLLTVMFFVLLILPSLCTSIINNVKLSIEDTRSVVTHWFEKNVSPGSRVLSQAYGPRLAYTPDSAREVVLSIKKNDHSSGKKFSYLVEHPPLGRPLYYFIEMPINEKAFGASRFDETWYNPELVINKGIEWIVLSSNIYEDYMGHKDLFPKQNNFHQWINNCWEEVAKFGRHEPEADGVMTRWLGRRGPTILVFRRPVKFEETCKKY